MTRPRQTLPTILALAALLVAAPVAGQGKWSELWRWSQFTTADGLPSNIVSAAAEVSQDGLWATTRAGFARYDGYRWQPVPLKGGVPIDDSLLLIPAVPGRPGQVGALASGLLLSGTAAGLKPVLLDNEASDRRFVRWGAASRGPVLLLARDNRLYQWDGANVQPHRPAAPLGLVYSIESTTAGTAWASTDRGIAAWDGAEWRIRLPARGSPFVLKCLLEAADGAAWAWVDRPVESRGLWEWPAGGSPPARRSDMPGAVRSIGMAADGTLVAVHTGALSQRVGSRWEVIQTGLPSLHGVRAVTPLANGDLALASDNGLFLHRRASTRWSIHAFPPPDDGNTVNDMAKGPDGAVWLATAGGLARVDPSRGLEAVPSWTDQPLAHTGVTFDARGRLWVCSGSDFRGVRWRDEKGWHRFTADALLDRAYVHRVVPDRQGGLWFLSLTDDINVLSGLASKGPGAFRVGADGVVTRWGEPEGLLSGRVYAFQEGPHGEYWFGTIRGISRWHRGTWRHWTVADGLRAARVFTLAVDAGGTVWFGHQARGLGRLKDDRVSYLRQEEGLAGDVVWTVRPDDYGRIWVATEGGLSLFNHGNWTGFGSTAGLPSARVWPVLPERGRVFVGTTGGGVAVLDTSDTPTQPAITSLWALLDSSGATVRWRAASWWAETPPEAILTRTRLDGGAWSDWTSARERRYSELSPGAHRVEVQAKGLLGSLGPISSPVTVSVPPPLLRRPVFYLPMAALGIVIAGLAGLLALRQRRHHLVLHERERLFTTVFRASPLPSVVTRLSDGRCLDVNEAFERLVGRPRDKMLGRTATEIRLLAETVGRDELLRSLRDRGAIRDLSARIKRASGETVDVVAYLEVFELDGRQSVLTQLIDVTEPRRLEAQLRQAQKMESIGRLAGGVAHDFNNLLTVILGNAAMVESALPDGDPRREEIDQIRIAGERAERLTRQLLAFARKQVVEPRVVGVNDVVLRIDRMLRRLIGEDIELVTVTPEVPPVLIDPGQLEQVLVNMAVNARDAMPAGGKLTITTSQIVIGEDDIQRDPETTPGQYVRLSIADTGVGMDAATASRVFEPFFTTKEAGRGTGLGLATCYGIVKQAGGQIVVDSAPGHGTTFHVDLPASPQEKTDGEPVDTFAETPGGGETILLVEDEVQVRELAGTVLRRRGYQVLEAADGPEALDLAGRYEGRIDLLVSDIVMPQMRGTELGRRLRSQKPNLPILYMSGYTSDTAFRQEAGSEGWAFLAKPFTPAALARRVREALDAGVR